AVAHEENREPLRKSGWRGGIGKDRKSLQPWQCHTHPGAAKDGAARHATDCVPGSIRHTIPLSVLKHPRPVWSGTAGWRRSRLLRKRSGSHSQPAWFASSQSSVHPKSGETGRERTPATSGRGWPGTVSRDVHECRFADPQIPFRRSRPEKPPVYRPGAPRGPAYASLRSDHTPQTPDRTNRNAHDRPRTLDSHDA